MTVVSGNVSARQLWFDAPFSIGIREQQLPAPGPGEILVASECSAISAGTELLVYRGLIPAGMTLDSTLDSLRGEALYPLRYGYACVGRIVQAGSGVPAERIGERIFAFQPHASHFVTALDQVQPVPENIPAASAVLIANMETAVCLAQDGAPALGENVVVLGQGIVGLLLTSVLARYPLAGLSVVDALPGRRDMGLQLGADGAVDAGSDEELRKLRERLSCCRPAGGADLVFEVSGAPEALDTAIDLSGFSGRIVIGSWYGNKSAPVALGGAAHRNRLAILTSQVSTLAPALSGRWDKGRRFETAWDMLRRIDATALLTHHVPLAEAEAVYKQLHQSPADILQAVIHYD